MELRKATSRIVFAFLAVIMAGNISIIRRNLENGVVDTLTQSPTVSALEHVNAYPVEY